MSAFGDIVQSMIDSAKAMQAAAASGLNALTEDWTDKGFTAHQTLDYIEGKASLEELSRRVDQLAEAIKRPPERRKRAKRAGERQSEQYTQHRETKPTRSAFEDEGPLEMPPDEPWSPPQSPEPKPQKPMKGRRARRAKYGHVKRSMRDRTLDIDYDADLGFADEEPVQAEWVNKAPPRGKPIKAEAVKERSSGFAEAEDLPGLDAFNKLMSGATRAVTHPLQSFQAFMDGLEVLGAKYPLVGLGINLTKLGIAALGAAKAISIMADRQLESSRNLQIFNAQIANVFARLDFQQRQLNVRLAQATSGSATLLGKSAMFRREQTQWLREDLQEIINILGAIANVAVGVGGMIGKIDRDLLGVIFPQLDIFIKEGKGIAWAIKRFFGVGGGKMAAYQNTLQAILSGKHLNNGPFKHLPAWNRGGRLDPGKGPWKGVW